MAMSVISQMMSGDCPQSSKETYSSVFFQNGTAAFKAIYMSSKISINTINKSTASCGFLPINSTISGVFEKVKSCICSYCEPVSGTMGGCELVSILNLYSLNTTLEDNNCVVPKLSANCPYDENLAAQAALGTAYSIAFALAVTACCCYCCYTYIKERDCTECCRRNRDYRAIH